MVSAGQNQLVRAFLPQQRRRMKFILNFKKRECGLRTGG